MDEPGGRDVEATRRPDGTRPPGQGLRVLAAAALLVLVAPAGVGVQVVLDDLSRQGEKFDGLGLALGGLLIVGALLMALPWVAFLRWGDRRALVVAVVLSVAGWFFLLSSGLLS